MPSTPPAPSRSILPLLGVAAACLGLLSPLIVHYAQRAEVDASMEVFLAGDERSRDSLDQLESMMAQRIAVLVLMRFDGIFSNEGAQLVHEVSEAERCFSLTRAKRPVRAPGFHLNPRDLVEFEPFVTLEPLTDAQWRELEALVTDYPWARDLIVSQDGRWTMLIAEVERELDTHAARDALRSEFQVALAPFRSRVEELYSGSFPFIEAEMRDHLQEDVRRFLFVLPVLLAGILLLTFRSLQVLACVLVFEAMGVGLVPVVFGWNGASINLYTGILFPLVAGLQLTFLTHFFAALRWAQTRGAPFPDALASALRRVVRPSVIAALTTVIGLLSLTTCDVGLVRDFGRLGAQAVAASFLVTFLPPLGLARLTARRRTASTDLDPAHPGPGAAWTQRLAGIVDALARHRRALLVGAGLLVLATLPAIRGVRTDLRAMEFLSPTSDARRAMSAVDTHMGGMNLFELEVECERAGGIQEPEMLAYLQRIERFAAGVEGVTNVYGYAQVFAMLNEIWERGEPGSRTVPQSPAAIAAMGVIVHNQSILFGESMHDTERRRTTLFIRTRDMPAQRYLATLERIVAFAESEHPPGVTVGGKTGLHSVLASDRRIVGSQVRSLLLCLAAVFATLCALWRSPRLALVAVLVNVPALAAVLALHGYAGIPLNSVTVMVGAVVLGIAVDNGIHVLSFWNSERARHADPRQALRWVLAHKLGPMVCTTAVLSSGFSLFLLSNFPPLADFGTLSILALSVAAISTAGLLPPLLLTFFPDAE